MAGHSKWANIKRRKGAQDAIRGKLFTKLIREITTAARMGGADIDANPRLRAAVDKAKANSMPRDNIKRAIDKGAGNLDGADYEEIRFEGYGPGGVAVIVECLTDNRNRTTGDVRHAFTKHNGNLGTTGCVGYMFNRKGIIRIPSEGVDEDEVMMAALEAGAEDVTHQEDVFEIVTDFGDFDTCLSAVKDAGFEPSESELTWIADTDASVEGKQAVAVLKMVDMLEDLDDVQNVYTNADIDDATLAELG
jgi:YebC/PmpR family DNA-binding regulatory protein